jgi:hypothetical protein
MRHFGVAPPKDFPDLTLSLSLVHSPQLEYANARVLGSDINWISFHVIQLHTLLVEALV